MKYIAVLVCLSLRAAPAPPAPSGFPFTEESLNYAIRWPSGFSLGEAKLTSSHTPNGWNFKLALEADLPGYTVKDTYHAVASSNLCSLEFDRDVAHGPKKSSERIRVDGRTATRMTVGGGKSEMAVGECAHDALTFLFFTRRELGQGRLPPGQTILYGSGYKLGLEYSGLQNIAVNDATAQADRVACTVTVPGRADYKFEIFFARDAARTPIAIRVPFPLGAISMELAR